MLSHMAKNHLLAVCHAFKIGSNAIGMAEVIFSQAWLTQLVGHQSAVREVEGSSPRPDQHSAS